jgi:hypothetical protein
VAGNTFRGVGEGQRAPARDDDDDDRPRLIDEDDTRGLHSGPTVVDDQKVAEVLRKLRSLDKPPGPLTGVTEVVVDGSSSEPTRLDSGDIVLDGGPSVEMDSGQVKTGRAVIDPALHALMRPTEIGRSASTPVAEQPVVIPPDLARGTLFGRSIHLPDVNAPDEAEIELSSGPIDFLDGAPPSSQPFPLADRPAVVVPPPTSTPARRFHTPFDADPHTQLVDPPRSKTLKRMVAFIGGLGIAGLGLFAWWQYGGGGEVANPAPAVAPAPPPSPTVSPIPSTPSPPANADPAAARPTTAAVAPKVPEPAAKAAPTPEPAAAKPAADETDTGPTTAAPAAAPAAEKPVVAAAETRRASAGGHSHARRTAPSTERRAAAKPAAPAAEPAEAAKPAPAKRKNVVDEDPDATMAPSL